MKKKVINGKVPTHCDCIWQKNISDLHPDMRSKPTTYTHNESDLSFFPTKNGPKNQIYSVRQYEMQDNM